MDELWDHHFTTDINNINKHYYFCAFGINNINILNFVSTIIGYRLEVTLGIGGLLYLRLPTVTGRYRYRHFNPFPDRFSWNLNYGLLI